MKYLVIIPTYNEVANIETIVKLILSEVETVDVLVVDDNSIDGTIDIINHLVKTQPRVHCLMRKGKTGLGDAYRTGFQWAIQNEYGAIVQMDADGSHRVEDLSVLIKAAPHSDVVIGSRWVAGGRISNWPWRRFALSKLGNVYGRIMLRIPIRDATSGFRVYSAKSIERAKMLDSSSQGYVFQLENSLRVTEAQLSLQEIPIVFVEREFGQSKMSGNIVKEAIWNVTLWGFKGRIFKRNIFIK